MNINFAMVAYNKCLELIEQALISIYMGLPDEFDNELSQAIRAYNAVINNQGIPLKNQYELQKKLIILNFFSLTFVKV